MTHIYSKYYNKTLELIVLTPISIHKLLYENSLLPY
jgi:hypothetical protein